MNNVINRTNGGSVSHHAARRSPAGNTKSSARERRSVAIAATGHAGRIHNGGRSAVKYHQIDVHVPHASIHIPPPNPTAARSRSRRGDTPQHRSAVISNQIASSSQSMPSDSWMNRRQVSAMVT